MRIEDLDFEDDSERDILLTFVREVLAEKVVSGELKCDSAITVQHLVEAAQDVVLYGFLEPSAKKRAALQTQFFGEHEPTVGEQIRNGILSVTMEGVFGPEWIELEDEDQRRVGDDYERASVEDGISPREYQQRIGRGNLASYAKALKSQEQYKKRRKADGM